MIDTHELKEITETQEGPRGESAERPSRWRRRLLLGFAVTCMAAGVAGLWFGLMATSELNEAEERVEALEEQRKADAAEMKRMGTEIVQALAAVKNGGDYDIQSVERRIDDLESDLQRAGYRIDCLDQTAEVIDDIFRRPGSTLIYRGC